MASLLLVLYVTNSRNNETFRSDFDDHTAELFCHFPDDLVDLSRFLSAYRHFQSKDTKKGNPKNESPFCQFEINFLMQLLRQQL